MSRPSNVLTKTDASGTFEQEIFETPNPEFVLVSAHGNGVRRWDGEKFYHLVAEYFTNANVLLVDQNQPEGDGVCINPFPALVSRVQSLIDLAKQQYKGVPIYVLAHSMGCSVTTALDLSGVAGVFFVAPAAGAPAKTLVKRYGADIVDGKTVLTIDGLTKIITKDYYESVKDLVWEDEYTKFVQHYSPVYVYEAGEEEILGEERFEHRKINFTGYEIIPEAKHNFTGVPAEVLFKKIQDTISQIK